MSRTRTELAIANQRLSEENSRLRIALRRIVYDARDEGRADMRDSVDEQFIEEARAVLARGSRGPAVPSPSEETKP